MPMRPYHVAITSPSGFAVSFEQAAASLERQQRLFIEPDGSFVCRGQTPSAERDGGAPEAEWQLDGVLYDRAGRLEYVEIKGNAPPDALDRLLAALGWPATPLAFGLVREGIVLDEAAFRRWLAEV